MRTITLIAFSVLITLIPCFPQDATTKTGSIRGEVFTKDEGRVPSVLPGAHVVLHGPATKETQSDGGGAYTFDSIPPGKYSIEVSAQQNSGSRHTSSDCRTRAPASSAF